jgi:D-arabinose 5-phosphate isomerase GutQ
MRSRALECARDSIRIEAAAVERMAQVVETPEFSAAVEMLATCPRVVTCASGTSGIAAKKFAHSLCCIERGAMFLPGCDKIAGLVGSVGRGALVGVVGH